MDVMQTFLYILVDILLPSENTQGLLKMFFIYILNSFY